MNRDTEVITCECERSETIYSLYFSRYWFEEKISFDCNRGRNHLFRNSCFKTD